MELACTDSERVVKIVDEMYQSFGSSTGHLFGLKPEQRPIAAAIVVAILRIQEAKED